MTMKVKHPSVEELTAFVTGQLPESEAGHVERHIDDCEPCSQTLVGLSTDDTFVELLKQSQNVGELSTMGMPQTAAGTDSDAATTLSEHPRYEIVEMIARGGMGEVFKAKHRMMDRTVALKVIKKKLMQHAEVVDRFHREVKTAAHLSHPNIVTAYDAEQADGVHFLVMEYVEGTNLADLVKGEGPLEISQACDYARQVATGLQHAHEQGMVHRDIKPHNLMLTNDGTVKILDFGLAALSSKPITEDHDDSPADASLTRVGSVMGTPDFISPEQAVDAHQADIRSDIYGLGATLYYLISGQPPFSTGGVAERLKDHVETKPVPINQVREDVPQDVADLIARMLEKDPADRYQDPQEVASALESLAVAQADRTVEPATVPVSRLPRVLLALSGVVIATLLAAVIYIETDKGTLAIETMDENVKVMIKKVEGASGDEFTNLELVDTVTGSSVSRLRSGAYKVSLEGEDNQYELNQDGFTLSRGGKVVITVTQKEADAPPLVRMSIPSSTRQELSTLGYKLTKEEALELQAKVDKDPTEIASRLKLMGYYSYQAILDSEARPLRLKLLRWFIENYPEDTDDTSMVIHGTSDPDGYVEIRNKWLDLVEQYPNNVRIIGNAANFVLLPDRELAEELLLKAQKLEPEEPKWASKLGHAYQLRLIREDNKAQREEWGKKSVEQFELAIELTGNPIQLDSLRTSAAKSAMRGGLLRKAKAYALGLLKDQASDDSTHKANTILGRLALQSGELEKAKAYLLASGKVSSTPLLSTSGPSMLLAKELLEKDETEVVLQYFELCGEFWENAEKLKDWTEKVEKGVIPNFGNSLIN